MTKPSIPAFFGKSWVKKTAITLGVLAVLLFALSLVITSMINNRLPKIIEEKNDTAYNLTYKALSFSLFNSSLALKGVEVSPKDSLNIADSIDVTGKIKEIDVVGINFLRLLANKEVAAYAINIKQPEVHYYLPKEKKEKNDTTHPKVGQSIDVSNVNVYDGIFKMYSSDGKQHLAEVEDIDIDFDGVRFNQRTVDKKIPFRFKDFKIKLGHLFLIVNGNQMIKSEKVKWNNTDFELNNFTMKPLKMNGEKYLPNTSENDLLDIESPRLTLTNMDWGFTTADKLFFKTDLIKFKNPNITIISGNDAKKHDSNLDVKSNVKASAAGTELINIKQLQIEKGRIRKLYSDANTIRFAINNADLNIEEIKLNQLTRTEEIPIDYKTFRVKLDSMYYRVGDMQSIRASKLDLTEKQLVLKDFKMKPLISRSQFNQNLTDLNILLDIEAPILTLDNNRWGFENDQFFFKTSAIKLDEVNVKILDKKNKNQIAQKAESVTKQFLINFDLQVDTISVKHSRFTASNKYDFDNVNLTVLGLNNRYGKQMAVNHIIFRNPQFTIFGQPKRVAQRENKGTQQFNDIIVVKKLSLINGHLDLVPYQQKNPNLKLNDIQLTFDQIQIDPKTIQESVPFSYKNVLLKASSMDYDMNKIYQMKTSDLQFYNGNLVLNQLKLNPKLSRKSFTNQLKAEKDLYTVSVKKITGKGMQWGISKAKDFYINSDHLVLDGMHANIFRSKIPPDDLTKKTMFSQKLREVEFGFGIKNLSINNSVLEYEEETVKSKGTGKLTFSNINATAKNINSGYKKSKLPDVVLNWRSEFMKGDFRAVWTFNPMNRTEQFNIKGTISNLPAQNLDPFMVPYLKASANGYFNQINFDFSGNDKIAGGTFRINYKDLKVSLLRDDGSRRGFLSTVGNLAIKSNSKGNIKQEKVENIERKQDKSFFNFFLACILDGLKQALLII